MAKLFSSYRVGPHELKNRLVVSPMCQYSAENGYANNWHLMHLGQFAAGGVGTVIQEATAIRPDGRISYGDLGLWEDGQMDKLREIVEFVHQQEAKIGIQLAHAGRKASTEKPWIGRNQIAPTAPNGWQTVAPSAIGFHPADHPPVELTIPEIKNIVTAFAQAARRAVQVGYDIIELHGAHGYLLHQFLSPLVNLRTDAYGGSFENRVRLVEEVVAAVRAELNGQSLWIRLSATDWASGGWDLAQTVALVERLKTQGVEVFDISSGGAVREQEIKVAPNYQVPFAEAVKKAGVSTAAVGMITQAQQAEAILVNDQADLICIARGFLRNPHLAYQFATELGCEMKWAPQYERAQETQ